MWPRTPRLRSSRARSAAPSASRREAGRRITGSRAAARVHRTGLKWSGGSAMSGRLALAGLALIATLVAWSGRERPMSVVVITLDTTRADRLPVYGFNNAPMPGLERLARDGVVFDRATAVAPLTLPAHCSVFTGLF